MADQIIRDEVPATANQWFCAYRLVEQLILAGWTVVESSEGSGFAGTFTVDNWSGNFGSLVDNAWIVLAANSGQQLVFRRHSGGAANWDGWLIWLPSGGYTAANNQTDVLPGDLPANSPQTDGSGILGVESFEVRGTFQTPQTYTTPGTWMGCLFNIAPERLCIGCRDASGTGNESFWLFALHAGGSYDDVTNDDIGRFAFAKLNHEGGLGITDPNPYAWWVPSNSTGGWLEGLDDLTCVLTYDNAASTLGRWRRVRNAGQGVNEEGRRYGSGQEMQGDSSAFPVVDGDNPPWDSAGDTALYQATPQQVIRPIHLTKAYDLTYKDVEGGWTEDIYFANGNDIANRDTLGAAGEFASFGGWVLVWWDQVAGPIDNGVAGSNHTAVAIMDIPDAHETAVVDAFAGYSTYKVIDIGELSAIVSPAFINRVYDSVAVGNVAWVTYGQDDLAQGAQYPGPGVYGVDTSEETVETILDPALV